MPAFVVLALALAVLAVAAAVLAALQVMGAARRLREVADEATAQLGPLGEELAQETAVTGEELEAIAATRARR